MAPCDGIVVVDAYLVNNWGYNGNTFGLSVSDVSGLKTLYSIKDEMTSGNTIGRTLHAKRVFANIKKGESYTFSATISNDGGSSPQWHMTAEFRPM